MKRRGGGKAFESNHERQPERATKGAPVAGIWESKTIDDGLLPKERLWTNTLLKWNIHISYCSVVLSFRA